MSSSETPQTQSNMWTQIGEKEYKALKNLSIFSTTESDNRHIVAIAIGGDIVETEGKPIKNYQGGLSLKMTQTSLKMLQDKYDTITCKKPSINKDESFNGYIRITGNSESTYVSKNDTSKAFTKEEFEQQERKRKERTTSSSGEEAGPSTLEDGGETASKRKKGDETQQNTEIDTNFGDIFDNGGTLGGGPNNDFPLMTVENEDTFKRIKFNFPISMLQNAFDLVRCMPEGVKVGVSLNRLNVSTSESTDAPTPAPTPAPTDGPIPGQLSNQTPKTED